MFFFFFWVGQHTGMPLAAAAAGIALCCPTGGGEHRLCDAFCISMRVVTLLQQGGQDAPFRRAALSGKLFSSLLDAPYGRSMHLLLHSTLSVPPIRGRGAS